MLRYDGQWSGQSITWERRGFGKYTLEMRARAAGIEDGSDTDTYIGYMVVTITRSWYTHIAKKSMLFSSDTFQLPRCGDGVIFWENFFPDMAIISCEIACLGSGLVWVIHTVEL